MDEWINYDLSIQWNTTQVYREWTVDMYGKVNDSQNHCVKWEKPVSLHLYNFIPKPFLK